MKLKAYFTKLKTQSKIENEEFNKFIDGLKDDEEIPDLAVNLLEENFLTRERAGADKEVIKKIRAEALNAVDTQIKDILPMLTSADRENIEKEANSYKKLELIKGALDSAIKAAKNDNPDASEQLKEAKKFNHELMEKFNNFKAEKENQEKKLREEFTEEKKGMKLDWTLDKKFADYEFGDEYKPIKATIIEGIVNTIKKSHVLQLDESGNVEVLDPSTKQPKFNGNDQVTIDSLLAEPLKAFLKKNNKGDENNGQQRQNGQQRTVPPQTQAKPLTLREMAQQAVKST